MKQTNSCYGHFNTDITFVPYLYQCGFSHEEIYYMQDRNDKHAVTNYRIEKLRLLSALVYHLRCFLGHDLSIVVMTNSFKFNTTIVI